MFSTLITWRAHLRHFIYERQIRQLHRQADALHKRARWHNERKDAHARATRRYRELAQATELCAVLARNSNGVC